MKLKLIALCAGLCLLLPVAALASGVDNSIYKELLAKHVKKNRVSYDGFKRDEALLDKYLRLLSATDPAILTRNHKFAFYINAYNAFTIKLILSRYPEVNSIKEIRSFFSGPRSKKFISLDGWTVSLDHIEHEVLRPKFNDPRIHFAINCAAKSCPPLLNQPYEGDTLETQLDTQTRVFINRSTFMKDNTLYISKIFDWFDDDFNDNPLRFIRQFADDGLKAKMDAAGSGIKISHLHYDWTLNRQ